MQSQAVSVSNTLGLNDLRNGQEVSTGYQTNQNRRSKSEGET